MSTSSYFFFLEYVLGTLSTQGAGLERSGDEHVKQGAAMRSSLVAVPGTMRSQFGLTSFMALNAMCTKYGVSCTSHS